MRLLLTFLISTCITSASAQLYNGDFENWINFEGYLLLQGWEIYAYGDEPSVTQDFDAYEGQYAVKVTAIDTGLGAYGRAGTAFSIDFVPPSLDFYVKTSTEFGTVSVEVEFYNQTDTLNTYSWNSAEQLIPDWTFVSLPLETIAEDITLARISITAEVGDFAPGTAVISVDELAFGTINGLDDIRHSELKIYPNPAAEEIRFASGTEINQIEIRDLSGKQIGTYSGEVLQNKISVGHLSPACYLIAATLQSGEIVQSKLMIER